MRICTIWILIAASLAACAFAPSGTNAVDSVAETMTPLASTAVSGLVEPSSVDPPHRSDTPTAVAASMVMDQAGTTPTYESDASSVPEPVSMITFTIVYDNQVDDPRLTNKWGFACLVEMPDTTILFDTGGDAPTLLENMTVLGKNPAKIDTVVLSHRHGDHVGGVQGMLATGVAPKIYMLASFPDAMRRAATASTDVVEVTVAQVIAPGVWTTGEVGGGIAEQALVVETADGWVLVTGCAHPGIATMASRAIDATGGPLILAIGGFHLGSASPRVIQSTIADLRALGVAAVAPTHCTGEPARAAFAEAYGEAYYAVGAGASWVFGAPYRPERRRWDPQ